MSEGLFHAWFDALSSQARFRKGEDLLAKLHFLRRPSLSLQTAALVLFGLSTAYIVPRESKPGTLLVIIITAIVQGVWVWQFQTFEATVCQIPFLIWFQLVLHALIIPQDKCPWEEEGVVPVTASALESQLYNISLLHGYGTDGKALSAELDSSRGVDEGWPWRPDGKYSVLASRVLAIQREVSDKG